MASASTAPQMTHRKSESAVVPLKPGNAGGGKGGRMVLVLKRHIVRL